MTRPKPKPVATKREPAKVVKEQKVVPKKEYAIEKHKINQEAEIEQEIERELRKSQIRQAERKSRVIEHNPRYVDSSRVVQEEERIVPYRREATYDVVGRTGYEAPRPVADSYIVERRPTETVRVIERTIDPGTIPVESNYQVVGSRKSYVNPAYADVEGARVVTSQPAYVESRIVEGAGGGSSRSRGYDGRGSSRSRSRSRGHTEYISEEPIVERKASYGSSQNLNKEIRDKRMKYERDNYEVEYEDVEDRI